MCMLEIKRENDKIWLFFPAQNVKTIKNTSPETSQARTGVYVALGGTAKLHYPCTINAFVLSPNQRTR